MDKKLPTINERVLLHHHASIGLRLERWWVQHLGGENVFLITLAALIGIAGGYGAIFFRLLIQAVNHLAFPRGIGLDQLFSTPWYALIAAPAVGGLIVGPLVHFLAREAKGHGVPEVMDACQRRGGRIRPRVAAVKILASAISIGTGGSVGREGPIVQIGSSMGSSVGQFFGLKSDHLKVMVAAGAAAGIAATFNAPIAGILFSLEIILRRGSARVFTPLVVASVLATAVARMHLGDAPAFIIAPYELVSPGELLIYLVLGGLAALVGVGFTRSLYVLEDLWDSVPLPGYAKAWIGGAMIGVIALKFPQVMGVGYEHIEEVLHWTSGHLPLGTWKGVGLLLALVALKILATGTTIGSGGSGGIFAPSLFIGASLGGALGKVVNMLFPLGLVAGPGAYGLVAMGAVVAATTHAPLTAVLIVFELTNHNTIMLPLMLSCFLSTVIAMRLDRESIYTKKMRRKGNLNSSVDEAEIMTTTVVSAVARPVNDVLRPDTPLVEVAHRVFDEHHPRMYVVDEEGLLLGMVVMDDLISIIRDEEFLGQVLIAVDCMRPIRHRVKPDQTLAECLSFFSRHEVRELPVVDEESQLVGVLTRADVLSLYNREVLFRDAVLKFFDEKLPRAEEPTAQLRLSSGEVVEKITVQGALVKRSLKELDLRSRFGVIVFAVIDREQRTTFPKADLPLELGQLIEVFGTREQVEVVRALTMQSPGVDPL